MIRIVTDSVASIPADIAKERGIEVVTLFVNRDGVEYADAAMDLDAFYSEIYDMVDNIPTSSQPSQFEMEATFERIAQEGDELLGIFISSAMSGTFEGAIRAARTVKTHNINFNYRIIDAMSCCYDEAFAVFDAADARDAGKNIDECVEVVLNAIGSSRFLFAPESLTFLQKGGRIGNATALIGNLIKLSPVLSVCDGVSTTYAKVRTHEKALKRIVSELKNDIDKHGLKRIVVHYIGDKTQATSWAREVIDPLVGKCVEVLPASPVVGMHVGPAVALVYECCNVISGKLSSPSVVRVCAS